MAENERKKVILSGIQPTGVFTLGNYVGAIRNWDTLQEEFDCIYFIADQHAITVRKDPVKFRQQTVESYALTLACGIDPKRSIAFIQSHNPNHSQLSWILGCVTQFGELSRMTQFKDKAAKHADDINAGLFTYPVLMAADILTYNADVVPIGDDQRQHLELARNIAVRFNQRYGDMFTVPEGYYPKVGARIKSLQEPTKKMSKSDDNPNATVFILDDKDTIMRKFKRAVTDSDSEIRFAEGKDGINNLLTIYSCATGKTIEEAEREFAGKGYGEFKLAVGEAVADYLEPVRTKFAQLMDDKAYLKECWTDGAQRAFRLSNKVFTKACRKIGFVDYR